MDPRIPRLRRKLATIPLQPLRSRSFGEEQHMFRSNSPRPAPPPSLALTDRTGSPTKPVNRLQPAPADRAATPPTPPAGIRQPGTP